MPVRPRKPCSTVGCNTLVSMGINKCEDCQANQYKEKGMQSSTPETRKIYNSSRWRLIRSRMLKLEPVCRLCKINPARIIDHIVAIGLGGDIWDTKNLQPLCDECDRIKRGQESQVYRKLGLKKNNEIKKL